MRQWLAMLMVALIAWNQVPHLVEWRATTQRKPACPVECRCVDCAGGAKCCCANKRGIKQLFAQSHCDREEQRPYLLGSAVVATPQSLLTIPAPSLMFLGKIRVDERPVVRAVVPRSPPPRPTL